MSAKFFVVADQSGQIFYCGAAEIIGRNATAFYSGEQAPFTLLAQADDADQATRFVELLRNRSVAA